MTSGITQHYVAIAPFRAACSSNTSSFYRLHSTIPSLRPSRRWQSTVAKEISLSSNTQPESGRNEIPSDCFVESQTFPDPSLQRVRGLPEIDLGPTRPAKLESPSSLERRDYPDGNIPLGDRAKYLFKLGKSFLLFYKTGLKNVWLNFKQYRSIKGKLGGLSLNMVAKYGGQTIDNKAVPEISRSEYQLSIRTKHDIFKMIPFSLVFLICGEFTPLFIIALGSSVVPYTCRIPRQEAKDQEKRIQQDRHYMEDLPRICPDLDTPITTPNWQVEHMEAYRLGVTAFRTPIFMIGQLYHAVLIRPRLIRHLDNLVADTILIHRQGGPFTLSHQDMYEWANSYGLYALRQYLEQCQKDGQDPRTERLKTELLPKVDDEMQYMLNQIKEWSRLKPNEQWRIGLRTVGSKSPDWQARVKEIREKWKQA